MQNILASLAQIVDQVNLSILGLMQKVYPQADGTTLAVTLFILLVALVFTLIALVSARKAHELVARKIDGGELYTEQEYDRSHDSAQARINDFKSRMDRQTQSHAREVNALKANIHELENKVSTAKAEILQARVRGTLIECECQRDAQFAEKIKEIDETTLSLTKSLNVK